MSQDQQAWPNRLEGLTAGMDANGSSFQASFSPLTSGLKRQSSGPSNGWVSFDDDGGSTGFAAGAPAIPAAPPAVAPTATQMPIFPGPGVSGAPHLVRPPGPAAPLPAATLASLTLFSSASPTPGPQNFSPLTSSAAKSTFPTFASLAGPSPPPAAAKSLFGSAPHVEPDGVAVHRLMRPPSATAARPGTAAATSAASSSSTASSSAASGVAALQGPSSNPFAASANPQGATAAARSLDPFADLALKPHLPRPPPMAAARGQQGAAAAGPGPVTGVGAGAPPGIGSTTLPPAWAPPVGSAALSQPAAPVAGMEARVAASPGGYQGAFDVAHLQGLTSPARAGVAGAGGTAPATLSPAPQTQPQPPTYTAAVDISAAHCPPPPPYAEALALPSEAQPAPSAAPPYSEALSMPQARGPPAPPPPPPAYEQAAAMPSAQGRLADPFAGATPAPGGTPSWATFDDHHASQHAGVGTAAATAAAPPALQQPLATPQLQPQLQTQAPQPPPQQPPQPPLPSQVCVEVRLPPLKPKEAAWPKRLAAGMGCAFAAPGGESVAALQWCLHPGGGHGPGPAAAAEGPVGPRFELPAGPGVQRAAEDWDSAPAAALVLPPGVSDSPVTCMLVDPAGGSMWTGHKDGKVVRWSVWPGRVASYEHHWKAHNRSKVTCLALTPWGELWTGSAAGSLKVWQYLTGTAASRPPDRLLECRRSRLTLGPAARASAARAHSKVRLLAVGPGGRVVWSAGRTGLVLWGAYDGEFLGTLTPGQGAAQQQPGGGYEGGRTVGLGAYAGETGAGGFMLNGGVLEGAEINPQTGLESGLVSRPFVRRADPERCEDPEAPEVPVPAQVFKGLAGAAKFAAKLGKKIRQNFAGEAPGGGSDASGLGGGADLSGAPAGGAGAGKVVALVAGVDGAVVVAYQRGLLEKYTEWGRLLWSRDYGRGVRLHSAALVGCLLWLGCGDGVIRTAAAASGEPGRCWKAHDFPVVGLAHDAAGGGGSGLVYSLSENGSVRAWPAVPPGEAELLAWRDGLLPSLRRQPLVVLAATWNVNETRPAPQSLRTWLTPRAVGAEIVCVALQEVEMGTSSVARDAAITLISKSMLERGNQNAQWWSAELAAALGDTGQCWVRVALRQMSGLVAVVFCRAELQQHVGEVATANVACGVMGVGGNKGAVAVSMSVFRRRVMFVCSHFAAHQERVDERNDNYNKIVRTLHFDNTSKVAQQQQQQQQLPSTEGGAADYGGSTTADLSDPDSTTPTTTTPSQDAPEDDGHGPGLSDAALLVWAGDFNYRINGGYREVVEAARAGELAALFARDQCRAEMEKGVIFRGLREPLLLGHPVFVPTYKFDKPKPGGEMVAGGGVGAGGGGSGGGGRAGAGQRLELQYDTSEKQRVPAWTDRIFYRGSRPGGLDVAEEEVQVSLARPEHYNCVLEVQDSDHKPVYALLQVQLPAYKQDQKRRHSLASAFAVHHAALAGPAAGAAAAPPAASPVQASTSLLQVRMNGGAFIDLRNSSAAAFLVTVAAERPAAGAPGGRAAAAPGPLPSWLEVSPTTFALPACEEAGGEAEGADAAHGRARVLVRVLGGDSHRLPEPVRLHFSLRPLWGLQTRVGAAGPTVTVALTHEVVRS